MQTKEKGIMKKGTITEGLAIGKILRRHGLYLMFFGYVVGQKDADPKATWAEIAESFKRRFSIGDEIESESLIREAQKMTADYLKYGL